MRLRLCFLFTVLALPLCAQSKILGEIPLQFQDGLIWIKGKVAGNRQSLNFLLDSGAGVSAIDLQTARSFRLKLGERQAVQGVNGQARGYWVNDLHAKSGEIDLPTSVLAIDLRALSQCCRQTVDGILGADFFRNRIVQIDFAAGEVRLLQDCDLKVANCEELPIKWCNEAFCVPVRVGGNQAQWIRVDTGCDAALEWVVRRTTRRPDKQTSIGLSRSPREYVKTTAQIGTECFTIPAVIHEEPIFSGEGGLLGNGLLSKFCLTIDGPGNKVIFEKNRQRR